MHLTATSLTKPDCVSVVSDTFSSRWYHQIRRRDTTTGEAGDERTKAVQALTQPRAVAVAAKNSPMSGRYGGTNSS